MRRAIFAALLALAAATTPAAAQVVIGGAGYGYPVAPVVVVPLVMVVPLYPYSYGGYLYPDPMRFSDDLPSCYRFGRCSLRDLEVFRDRPNRIDRLAPAAPDGAARVQVEPPRRVEVEPTSVENIRPEYRGASVPREEFEQSGRPR